MPRGHINDCLSLSSGDAADCKCASEGKRYKTLAWLSGVTFIFEVVGGIWTGSLSLLSDAVHVLLDYFENILSAYIAKRARESEDDSGLSEVRLRTIGGDISAALIFIASLFIFHEGIERLSSPHELLIGWAIAIATIGLAVNIIQMIIHNNAPDEHRNITHTWQWRHLATDTAGNICVIIGVGSLLLGFQWGDLAATLVIVALIWFRVGRHLVSRLSGGKDGGRHDHTHGREHHH